MIIEHNIMRTSLCLLLLTLYHLAVQPVILKVQAASSIQARQSRATVTESSCFKFEWDFTLQASDKQNFREIIFGLWENGYTSSYLKTVTKLGKAVDNPSLGNKHVNYVGRVHWVGDISKSYAAFLLTNIKLSDNNTYGCELDIGGFGISIDDKITLIVEESSVMTNKSSFERVPNSRNVSVGDTIEFIWEYHLSDEDRNALKEIQLSCPTYNRHRHKILWRLDRHDNQITQPEYARRLLVSDNIKTKRHNNHQTKRFRFKLSNVIPQDERFYEFKIVLGNSRKSLKSRVFLGVYVHPRITRFPQVTGPYKEGHQLLLGCEAEGKPTPKINWLKNGQIIPGETGNYYHDYNVSVSDAGLYSCCASNQLGNDTSPGVYVHVQYAPSITSPSGTQTVLSWKENPTRLQCVAQGYPDVVYSWKRGGKIETGEETDNGSALTITPSDDSDFTNYTCIAKNEIGQDSKTFILEPIRPPSAPIITNIEVNYNAIKVTWQTLPSLQDIPITGRVIEIRKLVQGKLERWKSFKFKAKSNYFILGNLSKGTTYRVRLYATNVAGQSNASGEQQIQTLTQGRPGLPKLHFTDIKINCTSFSVTWDDPDDNGGAEVILFTVWYRAMQIKNTQVEWSTVNVTDSRFSLKLNCCLTYQIMVTAWNRNGQSFTDPENAARVTVLTDMPENTTLGSNSDLNELEAKGRANPEKSTMKEVLKYLPYLSFLALPVLIWVVRSKICKRTTATMIKITEDDIEQSENEMEELIEVAPVCHIKSWEFPRGKLAIERVIGNGAFGVVSKAYARDLPDNPDWTIVAVKSLQEDATESERKDLFSELNLLKKLKPHPHIIKLLGCITEDKDFPYMIIEYVPYGDLLGYLRRSRGVSDCYYDDPEIKPMTNLTSEQLLKFAWQISDGMRYISSKKIIHRDLAARNVLVGENHKCKITDFGMARDVNVEEIYLRRSEGRIPVKWTAIEAMTGAMKYSTKSDVWSFGVVLFEICTIGAEPYPAISPYKLPNVLLKGYRIPKPDYFKDELYDIMLKCWETEPDNRPSFDSLCCSIRGLERRSNQNYVNIKDCLEAYENEENTAAVQE